MEYNYSLPIPVPMGENVYEIITTCEDYCYKNKELFDKYWPPKTEGRCSRYMPCHTKFHNIKTYSLKLGNLEHVLNHFGKTIFSSYEEAIAEAEKMIIHNKIRMIVKGFDVKEDMTDFELAKKEI